MCSTTSSVSKTRPGVIRRSDISALLSSNARWISLTGRPSNWQQLTCPEIVPEDIPGMSATLALIEVDQTWLFGRVDTQNMESQSARCRLRAIACEQRAIKCADPDARREWNELAIEWHTLANASDTSDDCDFDLV